MPTADKCFMSLKQALHEAEGLSLEEARQIEERYHELTQHYLAVEDRTLSSARERAGQELAEAFRTRAIRRHRQKLQAIKLKLDAVRYVQANYPDDPITGLSAFLVGTHKLGKAGGGRNSVAALQKGLEAKYESAALRHMNAAGFTSTDFRKTLGNRDYLKVLLMMRHNLRNKADVLDGIDVDVRPEVVATAEATWAADIEMWQDGNRFGSELSDDAIGATRQSYDAFKVTNDNLKDTAANRDNVIADLRKYVDLEGTYGLPDGEALEMRLRAWYNGVTKSNHQTHSGGLSSSRNIAQFDMIISDNIASKTPEADALRATGHYLKFKSATAEAEFMYKYGKDNMGDMFLHRTRVEAKNNGLMAKMGAKPDQMYEDIVRGLMALHADDTKIISDLKNNGHINAVESTFNQYREISGATSIPVDMSIARWGAILRGIQVGSKLGMAGVAAMSDVVNVAAELHYQGNSLLSSYAQVIGGIWDGVGKRSEEQVQLMSMLGVMSEGLTSAISESFSHMEATPGKMAWGLTKFFKYNGLTWWTDTMRTTVAKSLAHGMALNAGKPFSALGSDMARLLETHGFDEGTWNLFKEMETFEVEGRKYMLPENVRSISRDKVRAHLQERLDKTLDPDLPTIMDDRTLRTEKKRVKSEGSLSHTRQLRLLQGQRSEIFKRLEALRGEKNAIQGRVEASRAVEPSSTPTMGKAPEPRQASPLDTRELVEVMEEMTLLQEKLAGFEDSIKHHQDELEHLRDTSGTIATRTTVGSDEFGAYYKLTQYETLHKRARALSFDLKEAQAEQFEAIMLGGREGEARRIAAAKREIEILKEMQKPQTEVLSEMRVDIGDIRKINDSEIEDWYEDMTGQLMGFFSDRANLAVVMPDARINAITKQGLAPGDSKGELMRFIMQFKSFPIGMYANVIGREVYGRGEKGLGSALNPFNGTGSGATRGLMNLVIGGTILGYVSGATRDVLQGKTVKPLNDIDTWHEAFLRGGSAGIWGDMVFGQAYQYGGGMTGQLAGPVIASIVGPGFEGFQRLAGLASAPEEAPEFTGYLLKYALNNSPGANFPIFSTMMSYYFGNALKESLNPGQLRRTMRRLQKDSHQQMFMHGSETLPWDGLGPFEPSLLAEQGLLKD